VDLSCLIYRLSLEASGEYMPNQIKRIGSTLLTAIAAMFWLAYCVSTEVWVYDSETGETENLAGQVIGDLREKYANQTDANETWVRAESPNGKFSFMMPKRFEFQSGDDYRGNYAAKDQSLVVDCASGNPGYNSSYLTHRDGAQTLVDAFPKESDTRLKRSGIVEIQGREVLFADIVSQIEGRNRNIYSLSGTFVHVGSSCLISYISSLDQTIQDSHREMLETVLASIEWDLGISEAESARAESSYLTDGFKHIRNNDPQAAINEFSKALEIDPNNGEAFAGRGFAYDLLGNSVAAIEDFQKSIELGFESAESYVLLGLNKMAMGESFEESIKSFTKAIELDPTNASAYGSRGFVYSKMDKFEDAINDFSISIRLAPNDYQNYVERGYLYMDLEKFELAIEDFSKAIKLGHSNKDIFAARGVANASLGRTQSSISDLEKYLELTTPDDPFIEDMKRILEQQISALGG